MKKKYTYIPYPFCPHNWKIPFHDFFFFYNKFAYGEYIHVHSVV